MKGEGDTGAQGHNNSRGYSSNLWKNAFFEFEYILVFMCLRCRMLVTSKEQNHFLYPVMNFLTFSQTSLQCLLVKKKILN